MTTEAVVSEKIVNLGRRLGMNTDLRRSVFYAVITSDVCMPTVLCCFLFIMELHQMAIFSTRSSTDISLFW